MEGFSANHYTTKASYVLGISICGLGITLFVDLYKKAVAHISDGKSNQTVVDFVEVLEQQKRNKEQVKSVSCTYDLNSPLNLVPSIATGCLLISQNPFMVWIIAKLPLTHRTCHDIQVI